MSKNDVERKILRIRKNLRLPFFDSKNEHILVNLREFKRVKKSIFVQKNENKLTSKYIKKERNER
jgi:hypothetical protein